MSQAADDRIPREQRFMICLLQSKNRVEEKRDIASHERWPAGRWVFDRPAIPGKSGKSAR
jgi:hypothetical protein